MSGIFKFGWLPDGVKEEEFHYENVWARERTTGPDRLVLAPSRDQCGLLLALTELMADPYWLLYVLAVPRGEGDPGRYQSSSPLTRQELSDFIARFRALLEGDSRQSLWIRSEAGSQLIYDRHNLIYAYGPLDDFAVAASHRGLREVAEILIPTPHAHNYNQVFDAQAITLLSSREWLHSPLRPDDEA